MAKTTLRRTTSSGAAGCIEVSGQERYGGAAVRIAKTNQVASILSTSLRKKMRKWMRKMDSLISKSKTFAATVARK